MSDEDQDNELKVPNSKAVSHRRLMIGLGFGAANLALLRKLPKIFRSSPSSSSSSVEMISASSTTVPASPSSTTTLIPDLPPIFDANSVVDPQGHTFEVVISGGRVIDPESGFDGKAEIGIDGDSVSYTHLRAHET